MIIFQWLNSQLLRMDWLSEIVGLFVTNILGFKLQDRIGASIHLDMELNLTVI